MQPIKNILDMPDTGGDLNNLNGKEGISDPGNSVPVMNLISEHNPKSEGELVDLIEQHVGGADCCDIVSQGTVEDFGRNLYEAQENFWGEKRYTLEECIKWEYDLFVPQSLKGDMMETKAISQLDRRFDQKGNIEFEESDEIIDNEYRIDIEVSWGGDVIAGIQVKPNSYKNMREGVKYKNKSANKSYEGEVFYLFYDYDSESFANLEKMERKIRDLIDKK